MEFSLFTLEDSSQDPVTVTPTRSFSNSSITSSTSSSSSSSSLVGINPVLKAEQHNKLVMSINEEFKHNPPIIPTISTNSSALTSATTSHGHPIAPSQFAKSQNTTTATTAAAFKQNLSNLSKSPNFNSFYFFNDDDDESEVNGKPSLDSPATFNTIAEEPSAASNSENVNQSNKETGLELDSVKHKLSSLWNNVKYSKFIYFMT
jgi:hypothetical protein